MAVRPRGSAPIAGGAVAGGSSVGRSVTGGSIGDHLRAAADALTATSATPRLDAEVLLAHVLGVERARLVLDRDERLPGATQSEFERLVTRRSRGEPVAYLVGRRAFRSLTLDVDSRVLVPRPETEGLVEAAVKELPDGVSVLDVGTGSGAIALALASERADLDVAGVDVSEEALAVARANATGLGLDVRLRQGDLLAGAKPVDAVIANLPYVERDAPLPVDVAGFEPALALFGGDDGLDLLRRLAAQLAVRPWPAWVGLEIGERQGTAVATLIADAGFPEVEVRPDLSGRDRIVIGRRRRGAGPGDGERVA